MSVIPFGLVGTIYGHYVWDVPLSMFSVVGLLGMTGIIINDSIVLVTTIDEHARTRGLVPSIIDGTADRLRPVMLTTLTTVLGLLPLLHETSQQAQFLKPTVITLVYGLGFGMVLVLLVVPSLIAAQNDIGRQFTALSKAFSFRLVAVRFGFLLLGLTVLAWLMATLGWTVAYGQLLVAVPGLEQWPVKPLALLIFIIGLVVGLLVTYVLSGLFMALRRSRISRG
mgnify:FL=1